MTKFYTVVTQCSHVGADSGALRKPYCGLHGRGYADAVIADAAPADRTGRAARDTRGGSARRRVSAAIVGVVVLGLLTGCDLFAPQGTKDIQETADGVNGDVGAIFVGNAVLLTPESSGPASLVATLVNQGESSEDVRISTDAGTETVTVEPAESVQLGTSDGQSVTFEGLDSPPGSLADVTFQTSTETQTLQVPVLDGSLSQYQDLVP